MSYFDDAVLILYFLASQIKLEILKCSPDIESKYVLKLGQGQPRLII